MATSAHGIVTRRELLRAGVTGAEIKWRLRIARGDEFRRYTFGDVEDSRLMLAELRDLLQRPA
jgi:hypothetical protein